jgi:hypothetical protein
MRCLVLAMTGASVASTRCDTCAVRCVYTRNVWRACVVCDARVARVVAPVRARTAARMHKMTAPCGTTGERTCGRTVGGGGGAPLPPPPVAPSLAPRCCIVRAVALRLERCRVMVSVSVIAEDGVSASAVVHHSL